MDGEACRAAVHGVAKSQAWLSDWPEFYWVSYMALTFKKKYLVNNIF